MNIIKVNYNNAVIKKPRRIAPSIVCFTYYNGTKNVFRVEVDPHLEDETLFEDFLFEIYFNDTLVGYLTSSSEKNQEGKYVIEISELEALNDYNINVTIKGKYTSPSTQYSIGTIEFPVISANVAQAELCCGENIFCNNYLYAYLYEGAFYSSFENDEHDGEIVNPEELDTVFVDLHTMQLYKWNSNEEEYQLLY